MIPKVPMCYLEGAAGVIFCLPAMNMQKQHKTTPTKMELPQQATRGTIIL